MKLYATTTSERASKGQGGEYLDIRISGKKDFFIANIKVREEEAYYKIIVEERDGDDIISTTKKGKQ